MSNFGFDISRDKLREELNSLGIVRVCEILKMSRESQRIRSSLPVGHFRQIFYPEEIHIVETWLEEQRLKEEKLSRDKELAMAKEANDIARNANRISWLAVGISAISLIASAFAIWNK